MAEAEIRYVQENISEDNQEASNIKLSSQVRMETFVNDDKICDPFACLMYIANGVTAITQISF